MQDKNHLAFLGALTASEFCANTRVRRLIKRSLVLSDGGVNVLILPAVLKATTHLLDLEEMRLVSLVEVVHQDHGDAKPLFRVQLITKNVE